MSGGMRIRAARGRGIGAHAGQSSEASEKQVELASKDPASFSEYPRIWSTATERLSTQWKPRTRFESI